MKTLVLNCGSSSIKYQLFDVSHEPRLLAKGLLERIGMKGSVLCHKADNKEAYNITQDVEDHQVGIHLIIDTLKHPEIGVIKHEKEIVAAGHRVVHGGENFAKSVLITEEVIETIDRLGSLAPLHNPANLKGILSLQKLLPTIPQVAVFDTSFHQTMPPYAYMYAIPYCYYEKMKIRRYGFHGTSHKYVAEKACKLLHKKMSDMKIITCHLGNGASITAVKHGQSVDSSMGFTPVEGLIMGTRCGDLDLGAMLYLMEKENLNLKTANDLINKKSGMLGISGISYDMRDIQAEAEKGNKQAMLALEMYNYRVKKYIGSYAAAMGGVDLIVFTGGIGENSISVREGACKGLEFLGLNFDKELNKTHKAADFVISSQNSKVTVMIVSTNEELVIALDTIRIVKEHKKQTVK
jgi:acetate kinase